MFRRSRRSNFALVSNRGCYGGCSFCALTFHQGRIIQTRSHESIVSRGKPDRLENRILRDISTMSEVRLQTSVRRRVTSSLPKVSCPHKQCLFPQPCKNLKVDHKDYLSLLRKLRQLPNVKKVFIRSGIRFDYLIGGCQTARFYSELCEHHVSGQLKVAPEHVARRGTGDDGQAENGSI